MSSLGRSYKEVESSNIHNDQTKDKGWTALKNVIDFEPTISPYKVIHKLGMIMETKEETTTQYSRQIRL